MLLNDKELRNAEQWENKNIILPRFDRDAVRKRTYKEPVWVHFGAGNIFRAYLAVLQQRLLEKGLQDTGIMAYFRASCQVPIA